MATRRMFHTDVVECDRFLDMSHSAQLIYFHLGMQADDDGFVNCPKQICRNLRLSFRGLQELVDNGFLFNFDGIVVLKHFKIANVFRNERKRPLNYPELAKKLRVLQNRCYTTEIGEGEESLYDARNAATMLQDDSQLAAQEKRTEENRTEEKGREEKKTEAIYEGSRREGPADGPGQLRFMGGTLWKGVLLLSDDQIEHLLDRMGLDAFNYYTEKLATLLQEDKVRVKNHYATIMRWYLEDSEVET